MNKIRIISSVIALFIFMILLRNSQTSSSNLSSENTSVILVKKNTERNKTLTNDDFYTTDVPISILPEGYIVDAEEVIGAVNVVPLTINEIITKNKIEKQGGSKSGISSRVKDNLKAITISVDESTGIASLIKQGNYVDIISVHTRLLDNKRVSALMVENVEVLALDSYSENEQGNNKQFSTVTLLVTPEQGLKISMSEVYGKNKIMIRNSSDTSLNSEKIIIEDDVFN